MDRSDLPSLDGWLSLGSNRMEAATEDRAVLPAMIDFMLAAKKSFILHELVYGHSPEWQATTGKTQLQYYDEYLTDLLDRMITNQLEANTLIVVVSDHGDRAYAQDAENYRIPLLVIGSEVQPAKDDSFRSHLDLDSIIASYLGNGVLQENSEKITVVGSTEQWVYGEITQTGDHLFIEDRTGHVQTNSGNLQPSQLHSTFQALLDEFGRRYGK